jgi:uncharacterized protein (TIGR03437 family)
VATVTVLYTGFAYGITSAEVGWQLSYQLAAPATFASLRVYGGSGTGGDIAVAADVIPGTQSAGSRVGTLSVPATEIDMTNAALVKAVQGMLTGPTAYSVEVATVENLTQPLAGQLRGTDSMSFQIASPHETGAAWAAYIHTLRQSSGAVEAGTIIFDLNYREPAGAQLTLLNIDGDIAAPAASLNSSGVGDLYLAAHVFEGAGLTSLNDIVSNPDKHTLNVQMTSGGSYSLPLAPPEPSLPAVAAVIPIVEVKTLNTFAPGELIEIYGTNLAKVTVDLSGWPGNSLPTSLNGVSVTVGGQAGRILYVSPEQVDAELAFETSPGSQPLVLTTGNGPSAPLLVNLATVAPALYGFAFENANFSLVCASHPAKAGDVLVFYASGMGQTTPALTTGQVTPAGPPFFATAPVSMAIGGQSAKVVYSIAAPPYVTGLYQIAVTVPSGLGAGPVPVVASAQGMPSNTITIPVE